MPPSGPSKLPNIPVRGSGVAPAFLQRGVTTAVSFGSSTPLRAVSTARPKGNDGLPPRGTLSPTSACVVAGTARARQTARYRNALLPREGPSDPSNVYPGPAREVNQYLPGPLHEVAVARVHAD